MDQPQDTGSEPYGEAAPPPMAAAPPPVRRTDVSKPGLVIAVIALALALVGMVAFPGPVGEEGPQGEIGPQGPDGDDGDDGSDGATGPTGPQGPSGANGTACWDLNGNGTGDLPDEDINGDLVVDVLDCAGPQGPQGIQGPPGPGTLMAFSTVIDPFQTIGSLCTNYPGLTVTITVPSAGTVVVNALILVHIDHTVGVEDRWIITISQAPDFCGVDPPGYFIDVIPSDTGSGIIWESGSSQVIFPVVAGTYTFYLNGYMVFGQDAGDWFDRGTMTAVFYPS